MKLNTFLSHAGVCSRRKAVDLIKKGDVSVNGNVVKEGYYEVKKDDRVFYKGRELRPEKKTYILLNKPKNCITTVSDEKNRKTVLDLIPENIRERLYPVGRLDRNTTGLLLLTNDGELAQKLSHPRYEISKMYHVKLDKSLTQKHFERLKKGISLVDGVIHVDDISYDGNSKRMIIVGLHSGKNRIVRRMFEHLGYEVFKLDRIGYAGLNKQELKCGEWRYLTSDEVSGLKKE
jgi:23S rRNA pseudouridine2605 synthase